MVRAKLDGKDTNVKIDLYIVRLKFMKRIPMLIFLNIKNQLNTTKNKKAKLNKTIQISKQNSEN